MKTTTKVLFHRKFQAVAMVAAAGSTLFLNSFTQPNPSLQLEFTKVQKKGTLYISVCSNAAEWIMASLILNTKLPQTKSTTFR
jgi:hypothetical protein